MNSFFIIFFTETAECIKMTTHIGTDFTACPSKRTGTCDKYYIVSADNVTAAFRKSGPY